jgi:hypothetical protein
MGSRATSPRLLVLAAVFALHAGTLLVLLAEMRTRTVRGEAQASALIVMLFDPRVHQASGAPTYPGRRKSVPRSGPAAAPVPTAVAAHAEPEPGAAIDWGAEAALSAGRQIEADEQRVRQAHALAVRPSPMFAQRRKPPGFHWNYASTHRVEPVGGFATVIHLNDQCAIALFLIIPFAGGCALDKAPPRADLFEHLHDPDPAPEP